MHPHLEIKETRRPESLLPPSNPGEQPTHPNADRLEQHLVNLHPSKRTAYLETAYVRAIKQLPDNNDGNYIPSSLLAEIIDRWMPESEQKTRKLVYLRTTTPQITANQEDGENPYAAIAEERKQIKALLSGQKGDLF